ncbi:MAG TPA: cytochrome c maturation protein CcmE [Acidimicrobiia bacterium]|nr:cytochrome c maturation protein CcmE [Acidimicrobiia bacterium]
MPYRKFIWPALAAVAAIVIALIATNLGNSLTYYLTPSEAVSRRAEFGAGERFRLGGLVVMGSLDDQGIVKLFDVTDGATTVRVRLEGTVPPLFAEDVGVVVEGTWSGDQFAADLALIRHDENYRPPSTAAS